MGGLEDLIVGNAPGGALVALIVGAVLAVWRGLLVPRWTVEKLEATAREVAKVQAERLADSQEREKEWRGVVDIERARGDLQARQIDELLELARLDHAVLTALRTATGGNPT